MARQRQQQSFRQVFQSIMLVALCLACSIAAVDHNVTNNEQKPNLPVQTVEEDDDRTLLDMFGEAAKEYLTQRMIPDTDAECKWDWRYARCEPYCDCAFIPKLGDYHLGRSCRKLEQDLGADTCHLPPETPYERIMMQALVRAKMASQKTKETVSMLSYRSIQKLKEEQERTCSSDVDNDEDTTTRRATWKQRVLCRGQAREVESNDVEEDIPEYVEENEELSEKERWELWT